MVEVLERNPIKIESGQAILDNPFEARHIIPAEDHIQIAPDKTVSMRFKYFVIGSGYSHQFDSLERAMTQLSFLRNKNLDGFKLNREDWMLPSHMANGIKLFDPRTFK